MIAKYPSKRVCPASEYGHATHLLGAENAIFSYLISILKDSALDGGDDPCWLIVSCSLFYAALILLDCCVGDRVTSVGMLHSGVSLVSIFINICGVTRRRWTKRVVRCVLSLNFAHEHNI